MATVPFLSPLPDNNTGHLRNYKILGITETLNNNTLIRLPGKGRIKGGSEVQVEPPRHHRKPPKLPEGPLGQ